MSSSARSALLTSEDWWAIWVAALLIGAVAFQVVPSVPSVEVWTDDLLGGMAGRVLDFVLLGLGLALVTGIAVLSGGTSLVRYQAAFVPIFIVAFVVFLVSAHAGIRASGLGYALWAPVFGLLVSNTVGTPAWMRPALRGEFFIRIGLVLLGAELLFNKMIGLGVPAIVVAWGVTPVVVVAMYWWGTRVLRMTSPSLVIVVAATAAVCGVSAGVAAAGASRAKKEELMIAIGLTLVFTILMMVGMPLIIYGVGLDPIVGGALIGGTVDATGAVVAAAAMLGEEPEQVAAVVKMVQNMLIGVIAFGIALYWAARVEPASGQPPAGPRDIWDRFPKFILGFVGASIVFSFVLTPTLGDARVADIVDLTSELREWFFCLGFVAIGLDANLGDLMRQAAGGRSIQLYVGGQAFNIVLTLAAAYLAFGGVLFDRPL